SPPHDLSSRRYLVEAQLVELELDLGVAFGLQLEMHAVLLVLGLQLIVVTVVKVGLDPAEALQMIVVVIERLSGAVGWVSEVEVPLGVGCGGGSVDRQVEAGERRQREAGWERSSEIVDIKVDRDAVGGTLDLDIDVQA